MALLSKATTSDKFHKLSWNPMSNDQYPLGLIASAMESGSITIYDPKTLIEGYMINTGGNEYRLRSSDRKQHLMVYCN